MDAGSTHACERCGQANPVHRLWCLQCGRPLSEPAHPASTANTRDHDQALAGHIELYGKVLGDLDCLASRGEIPTPTFDLIATFYRDLLAEKQLQAETQRRVATLRKCVSSVRALAHSPSGRLQEAIHKLGEGVEIFPEEQVLAEMLVEVRARVQQQARAQLAATKASELFVTAQACLRESRLQEAEAKLIEALKLEPNHREMLTTLGKVRGLLQEASRRRDVPETTAPVSAETASRSAEIMPALLPELASMPAGEAPFMGKTSVEPTVRVRQPTAPTFAEEEIPSPAQRWVEAASEWSKMLKPFLLDNVGWFIGVFLIIAGFVVLITTFWNNIEENRLLMLSLVYLSLFVTTGMIFALAYFLRVKRPELETSSNVLLIIVALLIPLVFAAAALTTLLPVADEAASRASWAHLPGIDARRSVL